MFLYEYRVTQSCIIQPWCDPIQYLDTGLPIKDEASKTTLQIRFSHFLTFVILDF